MPVFEDWLKEPLKIISNIHASDSSNFDLKVIEFFESKFKSQKNYNSIPRLNDVSIQDLTPNCLVRYRCMIQDSSNPEYFILNHKLRNDMKNDIITLPSKYKDIVTYPDGYELCNDNLDENHSSENLGQRCTFFCVPVPGESEWVKSVYKSNITSTVSSIPSTSNYQNRPSKRAIDEQENEDNEENTIHMTNEQSDYLNIKRPKTFSVSNNNENSDTNKLLNLNYPLQDQPNGISCLVKVYDNLEQFKINDLVEFVGVLTIDPSLAFCNQCLNKQKQQQTETTENNQMETDNEISNYMLDSYRQTFNTCSCSYAPPSLVPRLHSIKSFHLKHENPLVDSIRGESIDENNEKTFWTNQIRLLINSLSVKTNPHPIQNPIESSNLHLLIKLRQEITNYFQEYLLLGDALAAEYLLMNIISGIFTRKDVTILGKFALNIFGVPSIDASTSADETFSNIFYKYFKELLTTSHLFKLSVDSLNKANFIPNKDYNNDKLMSGMLQLPDRFQLVVDETILNAGELKQKGLINMHALNDIIKWQKLNYDFEFHSQEFLTNIRVLILSNSKSILASDCQIKLKPSINLVQYKSEDYEANLQRAQKNESHSNFLNNLRKYLTIVSRLDYKLTENIQKFVEEDFVMMRQGNANEKICVEDFHLLLVIARLQCLTYARNELSINEWNKAKHLEKERKARLI